MAMTRNNLGTYYLNFLHHALLGSTETAWQKLKYAIFEGGVFNFSWEKKRFLVPR
jgi:hypothetical protein